jgi:hypothetical protein
MATLAFAKAGNRFCLNDHGFFAAKKAQKAGEQPVPLCGDPREPFPQLLGAAKRSEDGSTNRPQLPLNPPHESARFAHRVRLKAP